ncbi:hypothetical protein SB861_06075 [Paraburkholderia sp. SIMBA_049]
MNDQRVWADPLVNHALRAGAMGGLQFGTSQPLKSLTGVGDR